jgi:Phasin protein
MVTRTSSEVGAALNLAGRADRPKVSPAIQGTIEFNKKAIEIAQANVNAAFDCAREMVDAKSPAEFMAIYTQHVSQQFQAITRQTRELAELAQKAAVDSTGPDMVGSAALSSGIPDRLRYSSARDIGCGSQPRLLNEAQSPLPLHWSGRFLSSTAL